MNEGRSIAVRPLADTPFAQIHEAFLRAFADYAVPMRLSVRELEYMLERRGCDLSLSVGAFVDDRLVGFILNGIGPWVGELTAYDTGTGVERDYRGLGIASRLISELVPILREHDVAQYLLEVIQENTAAVRLYRKQGFEVCRRFSCYQSAVSDLRIAQDGGDSRLPILPVDAPNWDRFRSFWDFAPSWQNSVDSVLRKREHFTILGAFDGDRAVGYGIIEKHTGDIPQIGVERAYRRRGLGTGLVAGLLRSSGSDRVRMINAETEDECFGEFARSVRLTSDVGQFEMILRL